jgi:hypothetical protein
MYIVKALEAFFIVRRISKSSNASRFSLKPNRNYAQAHNTTAHRLTIYSELCNSVFAES